MSFESPLIQQIAVPAPAVMPGWLFSIVRRFFRLLLAGSFLAGNSALSSEPVSKEYQLKAAFLFNFAKFVEWPPQSFPDAGGPIVIGILGGNPFGDELENAIQGRK